METNTRFLIALIITTGATLLIDTEPGGGQQPMDGMHRTGAISGRVLSAAALKPAPRVRVQLTTTEASQTASVVTDATGGFAFGNLPAGRYWLRAEGDRLQTTYHGQRSPADPARSIVLRDGQQITDIELVPQELGVLVGRVLNAHGEPVHRAHVVAMASDLKTTLTNDIGQFRIPQLVPGQYLVWVIPPGSLHLDGPGDERYALTFAPGTADMKAASPITVTYGAESSVDDIVLTRGALSAITGRVVDADGRAVRGAAVTLGIEQYGDRASLNIGRAWTDSSTTGEFSFSRVPEGRYTLRATLGNQHGALELTAPLVSHEAVVIVVHRIASVSGQLVLEPGAKSLCRTPAVAALPLDAPAASDRAAQIAAVHPDGTFTLKELSGRQQIDVHCSRGVFARIRRMAVNGKDVDGHTLDAATLGGASTLKITAAPPANRVVGNVTDDRGEPGAGLAVIVRDDPGTWRMPFQYLWTSVIIKGQYGIDGLPPGRYLAFHEPPRRVGELESPIYLHMVRGRATAFEIPEEAEVVVPLTCR